MKNTTKGLLAGAAGLGLVLGGSTLALWSDGDTLTESSAITSGNLDVAVKGGSWYDVSPDRTDSPHKIDLESFRIIPRDQIQRDYDVKVALEGDNMVAELALTNKGKAYGKLAPGLKVRYQIFDRDGNELGSSTDESIVFALASEDNNNRAATTIPVDAELWSGDPEFTVRVTVEFKDVGDQDFTEAHAHLKDSGLELRQIRANEAGFNVSDY